MGRRSSHPLIAAAMRFIGIRRTCVCRDICAQPFLMYCCLLLLLISHLALAHEYSFEYDSWDPGKNGFSLHLFFSRSEGHIYRAQMRLGFALRVLCTSTFS